MRRSTIAIRITHHQLNCTPYWPYPTHSHYPDYLHSSLFPPSVVFCGKVSSGIKQHAGRREASERASKQLVVTTHEQAMNAVPSEPLSALVPLSASPLRLLFPS
jgi:hypothetical protein